MNTILRILKNYRFDKKNTFYFAFFALLAEFGYLLFPQIIKKIIQIIELNRQVDDLFFWSLILAIVSFVVLLIFLISNYFSNKLWLNLFTRKISYYREKLFEKNYKDIIDLGTGRLITRLKDGAEAEIEIFHHIIQLFISGILRLIFVLIIFFIYYSPLFFVTIIGIIIISFVNIFIHKISQKYNKKEQELWEQNGKLGARIIMENLLIRISGKQNKELKHSKKILKKIPKYGVIVDTLNMSFYTLMELLLRLLEAGVYFALGMMILKGYYSIAYLSMVTGYVGLLRWPLKSAVSNFNRINRMWEKYKKLQRFIDKPILIPNGKKDYIYKKGEIEFKGVNFNYENTNELFNDFNIKFISGKKNALVGHSGVGKSTIIKILLRLFEYNKGKVLIDSQNLKDLKIETFYEHIGYLPQDPAIFDGTIRENLEYAFLDNFEYNDDIMWESLEKAGIDKMVRGLKAGLETEIGEKGIKLSGGEKQRLAIARIFLKNPNIIILDEPTSSLDSISESKITETLEKLLIGKTSIIIAHRLQTIKKCDKIIVINNGEIEAEGQHKELIKNSKIYKELVSLQNSLIN